MIDNQQYYDHIKPVLNMLARKRYPDIPSWCEWSDSPKCYICEYSFLNADGGMMYGNEVRAHGYQHLKERNLLLFV